MLASAKCIRTQADAGGEVLMLVRSKGLRHDVGKVLMSGDRVEGDLPSGAEVSVGVELDIDMLRLDARLSSGAYGAQCAVGVAVDGRDHGLACEISVELH